MTAYAENQKDPAKQHYRELAIEARGQEMMSIYVSSTVFLGNSNE